MAFVGTNVVGYYFAAAQEQTNDPARTNLASTISGKSVLEIFGPLTNIIGNDKASAFMDTILNHLKPDVQAKIRIFVGFLGAQFISPLAGGIPPPFGLVAAPVLLIGSGLSLASAPTFFLGFFLSAIATFALLYAMIKLLLRLVSSFLTIIFLTISAPFQFLVAALPGRQGIATTWILNMLANILVFPAVLAVFYFIAFILGPSVVGADYPLKVSDSSQREDDLIPVANAAEEFKIVGTNTLPLFGGLNLDFITFLLAFGALMALPKIPDLVVATIGKVGQAGQLLGQEIGGGVGQGQRYTGQFQGASSGVTGQIKRGVFGEKTTLYDPSSGGFERRTTIPGLRQLQTGGSWNPFKWKVKP